eukprot:CAMPEP_0118934194 /NCGR_PEP_ID=MMETSP1169-20130426/13688_1 /TAXON_ID=36882 /ORGANISM="Pyramimonas obovata, Strain CCMP722" /LENGTH=286 /DNA_ID=CAMNT_0006877069 /DNA_START=19 /DNA_END=879 /DNA_ORIENTATION=+
MGVEVQTCHGGMKKLTLKNAKGWSAEVYTHGAHIVSWKNESGDELIFVSEKAVFKPPKAIRGGIPICWPQFSDFGCCAASHGFARNSEWAIVSEVGEGATEVVLSLSSSEETLKLYPYSFEVRFTIQLAESGNLVNKLHVVNNGTSTMPFTSAFHTYFATPDITQVRVEGLKGVSYLDQLQDRKQCTEEGDAITFPCEVDRIYTDTPDTHKLVVSPSRTICIKKDGLPDAIVWNPWIEKAKGMSDLDDEDYKSFFCVEVSLCKGQGSPVELEGGKEWTCEQVLSVE